MTTPTSSRRSSSGSAPDRDARSTPERAARPPARLALADGSLFRGFGFGAIGRNILTTAEVVFNTAMLGYQESLTDPSYTGQILVDTFPLIGNTGTNNEDMESRRVQVSGFVIRELARHPSNFRLNQSLEDFLAASGVLGIEGVDTRAITRRLRTAGAMAGALTDRTDLTDAELIGAARSAPSMAGQNLVPRVGCTSGQTWSETLGEWSPDPREDTTDAPLRVLALDCGAKSNILRNLADRGCEVMVVPHDITPERVLELHDRGEIDGLFISNGPGDPAAVSQTIDTLRAVIGSRRDRELPIFGICLGHQLLSLAIGARTYKLKFGHRGANQPVHNRTTGHVEITSQNHGFAVDPESLEAAGGEVTHLHLNDNTVAGFRVKGRPIFAVQYHPEASPGPHDAAYLFDQFVNAMRQSAKVRATASKQHTI
ncbi:MAG: glutamine-hydrolyzing carbamoyl-phosphate synthase small subunit [Phycisphaeraceae bacterium]|nr:glutamine-hydrolyzing carbamoyl-phosphate synthase small subunit [Phycisphaeraceae bacterium]